jgi:aspartate aminotransferase
MTGWRVGYIGASKEMAQACDKMQGQFTSATCSIAQKAMHAAAELEISAIKPMLDAFRKRRDLVYGLLKEIPRLKTNLPDGAFYFFPEISSFFGKGGIRNANDLCMYLLDKAQVALVPGDAFGSQKHIRISYAASEENLKEAMKRIKKALDAL